MAEINLGKTKQDIWSDKEFDTEDFPSNKKHLNDLHKILLYALTVRTMGMPVAFTILFTNATRENMEADGRNIRNFILDMARKQCKGIEMFFVLEYGRFKSGDKMGEYGWHAHGIFASSLETLAADKEKIRKLCGDRRKCKNKKERKFYDKYALKTKFTRLKKTRGKHVGLRGWCDYLYKDLSRTKRRSDFEGSLIGKTAEISRKSKEVLNEIYEQKASLRRKKPLPPATRI